MSKRTGLAALLAASLMAASLLAACGGDDGGGDSGGGEGRAGEEIVIGWTPPDITGVFQTATDYFERSAEEANQNGFNVSVETKSPASHTAYADQLAIVEDFISQNVDVIAVSPTDTETIKPAIRQANDAGIPVIMVNLLEEQEDIDVASYIGFSNSEAASVTAYSVLDYFGGPGVLGSGPKVDAPADQYLDLEWWEGVYADADKEVPKAAGAQIEGIAGTLFSRERLDGFNEVIDQYPNMSVLGEPIAADWDREQGVQATEDLLSRYSPEEMNYIWSASNEMGLGSISVTEQDGVIDDSGGETPPQKGKVAIFTNDVTPESTDEIRKGNLIAETHHGFPEWGWFGTQYAVQLVCGQEVPEVKDIRPRTVYQGNVDQFYPKPKLPAIDWAEIREDC